MVNTLPLLLAALASANPTVYLIRHGEKAAAGDGLNAQGVQRAQCLRTMFGSGSVYAIGHVMAMRPKESEFSSFLFIHPLLSFHFFSLFMEWICCLFDC